MKNVTGIILILVSAAIFWWYINPVWWGETHESELSKKSLKELLVERGHYLEALQKTREIELARTGLLEKYNAIPGSELERLLKFLPDHIDSVRLIIDINSAAAGHGLSLQNLDVDVGAKGGALGARSRSENSIGPADDSIASMGLRFLVRGSYSGFRAFLGDLEQSLRLVDTVNVSFEATDDEDYDFDIKIDAYRLE